jgi:hypothetical protein
MTRTFKMVRPYLWRYRRGYALGMGALALKDLVGVTLPLAMRGGIDSLNRGFTLSTSIRSSTDSRSRSW